MSDGYWIMLKPLTPGQHTLRFRARASGFELDDTWNLTVQPGCRGRGHVASAPGAVERSTWGLVKDIYRK